MPPSLLLPLNPASTRVVCHAQKAAGFAKIIMVKQRVTPAVLLINNLNATLLLNLCVPDLNSARVRTGPQARESLDGGVADITHAS